MSEREKSFAVAAITMAAISFAFLVGPVLDRPAPEQAWTLTFCIGEERPVTLMATEREAESMIAMGWPPAGTQHYDLRCGTRCAGCELAFRVVNPDGRLVIDYVDPMRVGAVDSKGGCRISDGYIRCP